MIFAKVNQFAFFLAENIAELAEFDFLFLYCFARTDVSQATSSGSGSVGTSFQQTSNVINSRKTKS